MTFVDNTAILLKSRYEREDEVREKIHIWRGQAFMSSFIRMHAVRAVEAYSLP
jgi:hypothetical protein